MKNVERLPDCYRKDQDSNNYKLLELKSQAVEELKADIKAVKNVLDLKFCSRKISGPLW